MAITVTINLKDLERVPRTGHTDFINEKLQASGIPFHKGEDLAAWKRRGNGRLFMRTPPHELIITWVPDGEDCNRLHDWRGNPIKTTEQV